MSNWLNIQGGMEQKRDMERRTPIRRPRQKAINPRCGHHKMLRLNILCLSQNAAPPGLTLRLVYAPQACARGLQ